MNPSIEFLDLAVIQQRADEFRRSIRSMEKESPPLDSIYIAECFLRWDAIPRHGLFDAFGIDAALSHDLTTLYIDEGEYMSWEKGVPWVENRLRFTVAHEIGHFILHGDLIRSAVFETFEEYWAWLHDVEIIQRAEYQADEFAGRLLVPLDVLSAEYDRLRSVSASENPGWRSVPGMRAQLAKLIAPKFGVNPQVIETRFDRENIWGAE